jgi:uncharacterized protein YkvS
MKCSFMPTYFQECPPMSIDCGLTRDPTIVYTPRTPEIITEQIVNIADPGEFVELKAGLRKALEMVEMQERVVEQQMAPKTLEEAKMLQDKLEAALKSAQAMVRDLSKNK